jgi:hypothetical protein
MKPLESSGRIRVHTLFFLPAELRVTAFLEGVKPFFPSIKRGLVCTQLAWGPSRVESIDCIGNRKFWATTTIDTTT